MRRPDKTKIFQLLSRVWSGQNGALAGRQAEEKMKSILSDKFPKAETIQVVDISGKYLLPFLFLVLKKKKKRIEIN